MTPAALPEGFSWSTTVAGELRVLHHGRLAATLRGRAALDLEARLVALEEPDRQHLLARVTGQYRHGNERAASRHPRNLR